MDIRIQGKFCCNFSFHLLSSCSCAINSQGCTLFLHFCRDRTKDDAFVIIRDRKVSCSCGRQQSVLPADWWISLFCFQLFSLSTILVFILVRDVFLICFRLGYMKTRHFIPSAGHGWEIVFLKKHRYTPSKLWKRFSILDLLYLRIPVLSTVCIQSWVDNSVYSHLLKVRGIPFLPEPNTSSKNRNLNQKHFLICFGNW